MCSPPEQAARQHETASSSEQHPPSTAHADPAPERRASAPPIPPRPLPRLRRRWIARDWRSPRGCRWDDRRSARSGCPRRSILPSRACRTAMRTSPARVSAASSANAPKRRYWRNPARSIFFHPMRVRLPVTSPRGDAAARQPIEQHPRAGTNLAAADRDSAARKVLCACSTIDGMFRRISARDAPAFAQHLRQNIAVQHALRRHVFGGGLEPGRAAGRPPPAPRDDADPRGARSVPSISNSTRAFHA